VNGKNRVRLTHNATNDGFPVYSPDGKKIAYIRDRGRIPDIYAIDSSGGSKSRVTGSKYLYSNPSWGSRP
jgi:Tol biopolymer transport system component